MATRIQRLSSQCLAISAWPVNLIWEGGGYFLTCERSEKNWKALSRAKNAQDARESLNLPHNNNSTQSSRHRVEFYSRRKPAPIWQSVAHCNSANSGRVLMA